jgi:hypothetical protein
MKKKALYYKCSYCGKDYLFDKTYLPHGFVSPEDLDDDRIDLLSVDCSECNQSGIFSLEEVKKALENPEPPKGKWKWFWKDKGIE